MIRCTRFPMSRIVTQDNFAGILISLKKKGRRSEAGGPAVGTRERAARPMPKVQGRVCAHMPQENRELDT